MLLEEDPELPSVLSMKSLREESADCRRLIWHAGGFAFKDAMSPQKCGVLGAKKDRKMPLAHFADSQSSRPDN